LAAAVVVASSTAQNTSDSKQVMGNTTVHLGGLMTSIAYPL
jgi:hypothetical protein